MAHRPDAGRSEHTVQRHTQRQVERKAHRVVNEQAIHSMVGDEAAHCSRQVLGPLVQSLALFGAAALDFQQGRLQCQVGLVEEMRRPILHAGPMSLIELAGEPHHVVAGPSQHLGQLGRFEADAVDARESGRDHADVHAGTASRIQAT